MIRLFVKIEGYNILDKFKPYDELNIMKLLIIMRNELFGGYVWKVLVKICLNLNLVSGYSA